MTKSEIFQSAWKIAKIGQGNYGGKVSDYFSESLKLAYKAAAVMFERTLRMTAKESSVYKMENKVGYGSAIKIKVASSFQQKNVSTFLLFDGVYKVGDEYLVIADRKIIKHIEEAKIQSFV